MTALYIKFEIKLNVKLRLMGQTYHEIAATFGSCDQSHCMLWSARVNG